VAESLAHGAADAIVTPAIVDQHKAAMPHAQFNDRLHAFCESL
jgi:hypothetical protein